MTGSGSDGVVIVGAGHAGGELAVALRAAGFKGRITLVGEEFHPPYQRPPLSKTFLAGECTVESLYLRPRSTYMTHDIEMMLGVRAAGIDRRARQIELADGRRVAYGKLALATGGRPRRLPWAMAGEAERCSNFHYLRSIVDAERIRRELEPGLRLLIIGGGFIGLEIAAVAVRRGLCVTVLEACPRVLARVAAPQVSSFYERVHREAGVDVRTGVVVTGFEIDPLRNTVAAVLTQSGGIAADLVLVGIGLHPNVELAERAGLDVNGGIVVDAFTVTSDPDIVAVGDCTSQPYAALNGRIRIESVPNAVGQARTAAAVISGKPRVHDAVPWFWSDQYDLRLQIAGISTGYDRLVMRGSPSRRSFVAFYLHGEHVVAADTVNRPQEFMAAKRLIATRTVVDPERLATESSTLDALLSR